MDNPTTTTSNGVAKQKKNFALEYHLLCDLIHEHVKRKKIK